jgi:hypothetical protein
MPREVDDCSYVCDCGHRSDFFERTIRDLKRMSLRREQRLGDSAGKNEHLIVFRDGRMLSIVCPKLGRTTVGQKRKRTAGSQKSAGRPPRTVKGTSAAHRPATSKPSRKLSTADLDELVEEATVDAYDTEEQVSGFFSLMDDELKLPFETTVLGVAATVETIEQTENNDIVAVCRAGKLRQRIRLVDLPLPRPEPPGAKWIAAYRHWLREGGAAGDDDE